jgi:hypothetical protein
MPFPVINRRFRRERPGGTAPGEGIPGKALFRFHRIEYTTMVYKITTERLNHHGVNGTGRGISDKYIVIHTLYEYASYIAIPVYLYPGFIQNHCVVI